MTSIFNLTKIISTISLCIVILSSIAFSQTVGEKLAKETAKQYQFISLTDTIYTFETEFVFPEGYKRVDTSKLTDFQSWVSFIPIWHQYKAVGIWSGNKAFEKEEISRVVHIPWRGPNHTDIGFPLRILAEYLLLHDNKFNFSVIPNKGEVMDYEKWLSSDLRLGPMGGVKFIESQTKEENKSEFFKFLRMAMEHSSYKSLAANRLPITTALKPLDEKALLSILTKPKNALTKQYIKLFDDENVKLTFEKEALKAAVKIAQERKTGARALRSIFEKAMLDIMYEIPSQKEITEVIITAETIKDGSKPKIVTKSGETKKAS